MTLVMEKMLPSYYEDWRLQEIEFLIEFFRGSHL